MRQLTDEEQVQYVADIAKAVDCSGFEIWEERLYAAAIDRERERVLAIVSEEFDSEYGVDVDDDSCECQSCRTYRALRARISGEKP